MSLKISCERTLTPSFGDELSKQSKRIVGIDQLPSLASSSPKVSSSRPSSISRKAMDRGFSLFWYSTSGPMFCSRPSLSCVLGGENGQRVLGIGVLHQVVDRRVRKTVGCRVSTKSHCSYLQTLENLSQPKQV